MTDADYEAIHRRRLLPWHRRAVTLIAGKVADARAHAENAVTQTLRDTPDGRASAGKIRQSRSFQAAVNRLDELWDILAGESVASTGGMVHDAAEAFYDASRGDWWEQVPEDYRVARREPTAQQRAYARGLLWFGLPVRSGLEGVFTAAKNGLLAAVGSAGTSGTTKRDGMIALKGWEDQHSGAIIRRAGLALNDADQRCDLQAMRDTIRAEYRDE